MDKPAYPMRINKYLAHKGYATRAGADTLIKAGKVLLNGRQAVLGEKVQETDSVEVVKALKKTGYTYLACHKPKGVISHSPQKGETEARELTKVRGVFPVGRLDKDSHGLLILTNDGRITERLLNPAYTHEKEYEVRTKEKLPARFKEKMERGVLIEGYTTKECRIEIFSERGFKITLTEGKKHQIRRMCAALGLVVESLKRTRVMNILLGHTPEGTCRKIEGEELKTFLRSLDLNLG